MQRFQKLVLNKITNPHDVYVPCRQVRLFFRIRVRHRIGTDFSELLKGLSGKAAPKDFEFTLISCLTQSQPSQKPA